MALAIADIQSAMTDTAERSARLMDDLRVAMEGEMQMVREKCETYLRWYSPVFNTRLHTHDAWPDPIRYSDIDTTRGNVPGTLSRISCTPDVSGQLAGGAVCSPPMNKPGNGPMGATNATTTRAKRATAMMIFRIFIERRPHSIAPRTVSGDAAPGTQPSARAPT